MEVGGQLHISLLYSHKKILYFIMGKRFGQLAMVKIDICVISRNGTINQLRKFRRYEDGF